jgi:hypothetical protein
MNQPKSTWPWIITVVVLAATLYPLSFGPACWLASRAPCLDPVVLNVYQPLAKALWEIPDAWPLSDWPINALFMYGSKCDNGRLTAYKVVVLSAPPSKLGEPRF